MSSTPKPGPPTPGPPPERKAAKGPGLTPQVLGIIIGIILVVGAIVYWQMVVVKFQRELDSLQTQQNTATRNIQTYEMKRDKLPQAKEVNLALRDKMRNLDYLFLQNQYSMVPFFETTLFPLIATGRLDPGLIIVDVFNYKINMAMDPFSTIPRSSLIEDPVSVFTFEYIGEQNGQPVEKVLDTAPSAFLTPYSITLEGFGGTYENCRDFIEELQRKQDDILVTVHCFKNDGGENLYSYRTYTLWTIALTVYFMNPEAAASGDNPPDQPGAHTC